MPVTNFVFIKSTDFSKLEKQAAEVRAIDGVSHVFYGPKIEDPQVSVLVAAWSSTPNQKALASAVSDATETRTVEVDDLKVLQAPATEVLTCFGVESYFVKNVQDFRAKMDAGKPKGYHGGVVGKVDGQLDGKGDALMLLIGWDSKEIHEEVKGAPGNVIIENIHLLRDGHKGLDMFHVNFKEL